MKIVIEPERNAKMKDSIGWFVTAHFAETRLQMYAGSWRAIPGIVGALQDRIREELFPNHD